MKQTTKRVLSWLLALALVLGLMPGMGLTAQAKTETLLTTLTFGDSSTYSETTSGVVSVTATNVSDYDSEDGWFWYYDGSLSVTAEEGYTITKCVFRQNDDTITDTEAPFEIHIVDACITEDPTRLMDGVTSIEVYGYATPTAAYSVTLNPSTAQTIDVGGKVSFTATVQPDNASDKKVKWSVGGTDTGAVTLYSDENCTAGNEIGTDATETLTVYAKGISAGSATVTATSNADSTKSASCAVTVNAAAPQYYVVGSMNSWSADGSYLMTYDEANAQFQLLGVSLSANNQFKVIKTEDSSQTWYPEGMGNDYTITADGTYNIYFRPDGQGGDGWYEGCIKVEAAATTEPETGTDYASLKNTTTTVNFDGKQWYLIDYDSSTVTLLSKECVGASKFNAQSSDGNTYSGSTVEGYVNNWYTNNISADAKAAVNGSGAFLLTTAEAKALTADIRKCSKATGADDNRWWLRSPGRDGDAAFVDGGFGAVDDNGKSVKRTFGVRPALKLDLSKVTFDSETNTFTVASAAAAHTHDDITFTAWDSDNSLPTESGSYYLTQDVTLSGTWNVPTGETNLCLNGHSIILSVSGSVISVPEGATLNLYDCDETTHYVTLTGGRGTDVSTTQPNGTEGTNYLKVTGGCITGGTGTSNNGRDYGGGVYVNGGTFTMSGGTIIGNTANYGGGVYVNGGTFTMSGGTIIGNTVNYGGGGGVYNNCGSFTMQGGEITGNKAQNGGGVYNNSTFTMQGGEITGNTAGNGGNGGGVYVQDGSFTMTGGNIVGNKTGGYGGGGGVYVNRGSFNLSGGSITDNTAYGNGGGVYNYSTFTMEAGSITGNKAQNGGGVYNKGTFTMTGAPVIKDNTKGTGESAPKNNVYLYDSKITVNGALSGSAEVGVTMKTPGVFTSSADPIKASGYKDCFSSDDSAYTVTTDGNELKLSSHEHDFTYSATGATITATCVATGCDLPPSTAGGTDHTATLTIATPTSLSYDGTAKAADITDANSIQGTAKVQYQKKTDGTYGTATESAPVNAGTYKASITVGGATASVEYTIAQKEVTVSGITASDKVYDGNTDATLVTTAATVTGKLDGDALTVSATGTFDNANVGENKTVTISELTFGGSSKDNYKLASAGSQTTTTAKITAKEVGLTWSNTELAYIGEAQKPTATATGVVDGDTCTVTVAGEQANVGDDYTATAASLSNSNYRLPENVTTTFKIVKGNAVPATVTANNRTYDGTEKPLVTVTGEATGGTMQYALGNETEATQPYTTTIPTATDAGTYYVWYKVVGDSNHNDSAPASVTVTVNKAPLTITAKDKTIAYGDAPANDGLKYDSFVGGEDESVLNGELSYAYNYKQGDNSGEYTITPSGLTSGNYEITFVDGKLTVKALGDPTLEVTTEGEDKRLDIVLDQESAEKLLTEDELKDYNNGVPVAVYILVDELKDSEVPAADKKLAENFLKDGKIGQYLDLTLWVQVGDNDPRQITNAASDVTLKIAIPDALKVNGSDVERTFYLIRVHDGKAVSLVSTTGDTLEADSRLFSTYAIGYKDKTVKDDTKKDDTKKTDTKKTDTTKKTTTKTSGKSPKTGDTAMLGLWVTMAGASATGLGALALGGKKRKHSRSENRTAGRRRNK